MKNFNSPGQFAEFLTALLPKILLAHHVGMARAGRVIQEAARDCLGTYQPEAGPFPEWPELSEARKEQRDKAGLTPNDPLWATGELRDHIDMTAEGMRAVVGVPSETVGDGSKANPFRNIGEVAVEMEFGTNRAPARSFLGRAGFTHGKVAAEEAAAIVVATIASQPVPPPKSHDIPF